MTWAGFDEGHAPPLGFEPMGVDVSVDRWFWMLLQDGFKPLLEDFCEEKKINKLEN